MFVVYFLYFLQGLGNIPFLYWDEQTYINVARSYLTSSGPFPNSQHPPLAKEMMALSLSWWGDNPLGWRMSAVLCGSLALTLIAYLIFRVTRRLGVALGMAALLLLDPFLVVHARMGLLETPLLAFLLLASWAAYEFVTAPRATSLYAWGGMLGLALATKLNALVFFPIAWLLIFWILWKQPAKRSLWGHALLGMTLLPIGLFFLSYAILGYSPREVFELIPFMFDFHQFHRGPVAYQSRWYEWFWIAKPLWYFLKSETPGKLVGVLLTGNLVLWVGAMLGTCYIAIRRWRDPVLAVFLLPVLAQLALYGMKSSTFFYYMLSVLPFLYILLGMAWGDLWDRWGQRYSGVLYADTVIFFAAAFWVFFAYWPFIWGHSFSEEIYRRKAGTSMRLPSSFEAYGFHPEDNK